MDKEDTAGAQAAPATFHPFNRMPFEIKDIIWTLAVENTPSNTIRLCLKEPFECPTTGRKSMAKDLLTVRYQVPALLHTNGHARALALEQYKTTFDIKMLARGDCKMMPCKACSAMNKTCKFNAIPADDAPIPRIYFNFSKDIFWIDCEWNVATRFLQGMAVDPVKFKKVAQDLKVAYSPHWRSAMAQRCVRYFPGATQLIATYKQLQIANSPFSHSNSEARVTLGPVQADTPRPYGPEPPTWTPVNVSQAARAEAAFREIYARNRLIAPTISYAAMVWEKVRRR